MNINRDVQAELDQAKELIGSKIVGLVVSLDGEYFALALTLTNGKGVEVWVNRDPEGNGPGHLEIER